MIMIMSIKLLFKRDILVYKWYILKYKKLKVSVLGSANQI